MVLFFLTPFTSSMYLLCSTMITVDESNASSFTLTVSSPQNLLDECFYTCRGCTSPQGLSRNWVHFGGCPTLKSWLLPLTSVVISFIVFIIFSGIIFWWTRRNRRKFNQITEFD
eukprot:TRINITY_DN4685_c0_g2_i6.p1 TRINITY_DN4685_c0_g2~~TRINITY_DN4685_c0_g2_i6.p1  ORF type:complete len:114 (-),score=10.64 TRINITY_DN4685_c0_g2_i6:156-497(-)